TSTCALAVMSIHTRISGPPGDAVRRALPGGPLQFFLDDEPESDDLGLRQDRLVEERFVGFAPVVHRLEAFALVACELDVDLGGGNEPRFGDADDRDRLVVE